MRAAIIMLQRVMPTRLIYKIAQIIERHRYTVFVTAAAKSTLDSGLRMAMRYTAL